MDNLLSWEVITSANCEFFRLLGQSGFVVFDNSVLDVFLISRLGLALAASCAFYAVFASPSQDKLSGL